VDERATNSPSNDPPGKEPPAPSLGGAEDQHRLLMECVTDYAIIFLAPQGRVATWNAGAERIFGYAEAEIVGQHFSCFFAPEDARQGRPDKELKTTAETGRGFGEALSAAWQGNRPVSAAGHPFPRIVRQVDASPRAGRERAAQSPQDGTAHWPLGPGPPLGRREPSDDRGAVEPLGNVSRSAAPSLSLRSASPRCAASGKPIRQSTRTQGSLVCWRRPGRAPPRRAGRHPRTESGGCRRFASRASSFRLPAHGRWGGRPARRRSGGRVHLFFGRSPPAPAAALPQGPRPGHQGTNRPTRGGRADHGRQ
jgi:hypothetical protein